MGATAEVGCTEFGELPFGACEDPVRCCIKLWSIECNCDEFTLILHE